MEKITINLIPQEFVTEKKHKSRRSLFIRISVIIFICGLIATSGVLLVRLSQSQSLQKSEALLAQNQALVNQYGEVESSVVLLKNRLDKINQIANKPSIPVNAFDLINKIVPTGAIVHSFQMTGDKKISLSIETSNTNVLDQLFTSLLDPKINQGQIGGVTLDSIRLQEDKVFVEMSLEYIAKTPSQPKQQNG